MLRHVRNISNQLQAKKNLESDLIVNEAKPLLDRLAQLLPKLQSLRSEKGDSSESLEPKTDKSKTMAH